MKANYMAATSCRAVGWREFCLPASLNGNMDVKSSLLIAKQLMWEHEGRGRGDHYWAAATWRMIGTGGWG